MSWSNFLNCWASKSTSTRWSLWLRQPSNSTVIRFSMEHSNSMEYLSRYLDTLTRVLRILYLPNIGIGFNRNVEFCKTSMNSKLSREGKLLLLNPSAALFLSHTFLDWVPTETEPIRRCFEFEWCFNRKWAICWTFYLVLTRQLTSTTSLTFWDSCIAVKMDTFFLSFTMHFKNTRK